MKFTFFNKEIPVFDLNYDQEYKYFKITKYHNPEFAPFGLFLPKINKIGIIFNDWWDNRLIPKTRLNYHKIFDFGIDINILAFKNFGLSLSDQYWICPKDMNDLQWKDINLFQNNFIYNFDLDSLSISDNQNFISPNLTTNGNLPKKWIIKNSVRCLCKGASYPALQEPLNELIASKILDQLDLPHIQYAYENGLSICPCFIDENTEFVPAWNIYCSAKKNNNENSYNYCCRLFEKLDIPFKTILDQMLIFDYLIANEDRHFYNFGFIRDVNTLKFIKFAPLFDNGSSLWYNKFDEQIGCTIESKPFNADQRKQLSYIKDKSIFCVANLDIENIIQEIVPNVNYVYQSRIELIKNAIIKRLALLQ